MVSEGKRQIHPEKVAIIRNLKKPTTTDGLRSFMCMMNFYFMFLPNLKEKERPLQQMMEDRSMDWTAEREAAFEEIKAMVCEESFLAQPDWEKSFFLETDASKYAIGGVLYQYDEEKNKRPICWLGRKLTTAERNYCTREQELLALLYCVEKCRMYLYGRRFTVRTDCLNLCWLYENDLQGRVARWALKLNAYDFEIEHIKGKANVVADFLSRIPENQGTAVSTALSWEWSPDPSEL